MSQSRTLWEEGRESGRRVVLLGVAVALTLLAFDLLVLGHISPLFDVGFVLLCIGLALAVRPADFFTVGVLPPLLMVGAFVLTGLTRPQVIGDRGDGAVQAVITGLAHHASALIVGYLLCLAVLAVRHRVIDRRGVEAASDQSPKRPGSPAPSRTTSG